MKNTDLLTESYNYQLDQSFIADRPAAKGRHHSKLLVYHAKTGEVTHSHFCDLPSFLSSDHQLVMNESKVFPCRLYGEKPSGGKVEFFLLSLITQDGLYPGLIRSNGKKRIGDKYQFGELEIEIIKRDESGEFLVAPNMDHSTLMSFLSDHANIPIPPYIRDGISDEKDLEDYQTVYATKSGSVAAPTAGLHFTPEVFNALEQAGVETARVTLHVGAGTFKPVTADEILEHKMHHEYYEIEADQLVKINKDKKRVAVGTTSLRVLESCYKDGRIIPEQVTGLSSTDIFLYPGKEVHSIAGLLTNFHLPKSTLLMLVSTLIGREKTLELYEIAKIHDYRFFSYGDAMLILR
jgi:S-adenosylmethionine:tRNA ribosyltransferase-isomerase